MEELVVLIDDKDRAIGSAPKGQAHACGQLHRALSVFVLDSRGSMLLQRRSLTKYHSSGLWSNACCSHPRPGEEVAAAAHRRLTEEMGFDCQLAPAFAFTYRATLDHGIVEHERDHVFIGRFDGSPTPNTAEVAEWRWATVQALRDDVASHPERYTAWFRLALAELESRGLVGIGK